MSKKRGLAENMVMASLPGERSYLTKENEIKQRQEKRRDKHNKVSDTLWCLSLAFPKI